ncbi:hypothetical protein HK405_009429 [Cladochytrium tenue]|nr:hypothetical protein HK405_009429 [Cladochytrium tenue]
MARLRLHVATKRVRASEFFRDFDRLRRYSIPRNEFIRGATRVGLALTEAELAVLADEFVDPAKRDCCRWKDFEQFLERAFTDTELEAQPTRKPVHEELSASPYIRARALDDKDIPILHAALKALAEHMTLYTGNVTKIQFRQCLTYIKPPEDSFCGHAGERPDPIKDNAQRICYLMFLKELEDFVEHGRLPLDAAQDRQEIHRQAKSSGSTRQLQGRRTPENKTGLVSRRSANTAYNPDKVLLRIKEKAKAQRIRVIDFMADFDHLKHGVITKNEFRRALKLLFLELTEAELGALENIYVDDGDTRMVNYVAFSDAVESVFTVKGLEMMPLTQPESVDAVLERRLSPCPALDEREETLLRRVLARLLEKVSQRRIDPLQYLEDFDFVREGTITTNQFRSVLNNIELFVDDEEIAVLAHHFAANPADGAHGTDRINYRPFAAAITGPELRRRFF